MRRRFVVLICVVAFMTACGDKPQTANDAAATPGPTFTVTDSTGTAPQRHAIVRRDGVAIDTADVAFGIHLVGRDSVVYLPVNADGMHVLYHDGVRTPMDSIVPHFDRRFAAPAVIAKAFLYWGIKTANGVDSVMATRYEFARKRLNPLPVEAKLNRADPAYRFTPPFLDGKEIVFKAPDGEWRFRTPKQ